MTPYLHNNDYSYLLPLLITEELPRQKVTVVVPFFRRLDVLERTLASLSRQTYPHNLIEVIIVEDGSQESSEACAERMLGDICFSRVWISRRGYRLATTRNAGILLATGETIILLDFDIVVRDNFISQHMRWHRVSDQCITFGLRRFVDMNGIDAGRIREGSVDLDNLPSVPSISNRLKELDKRIPELAMLYQHPFPCNLCHGFNLGFNRKLAINVGLFSEDFNGNSNYEDLEFCHRMVGAGCYVIHAMEAYVFHQENDVIDFKTRQYGMSQNRAKLYKKVPGLREFRESIERDSHE